MDTESNNIMNDIIKTAIIIGISYKNEPENKVDEYLDELEFLAHTANIKTIKRFKQRLDKIDPQFFLGQGKILEISNFIKENEIDTIIFDEQLSPSHFKNLSKIIKIQITDRTRLILDIFAHRARTSTAKKQVELAQYQYLLPFLAGRWQHLERQRGGIGLRGPGEKEIETDRRIIKDKINKLKEDLKKIDIQKKQQRSNRGKMVRVALVGYTNVGKSTILNLLAKEQVFAENKLFATLDTTVRKVTIDNIPFLLTDTVGFIRKLPHTLVEAFKSTLDEVIEADIIVHVVDISHSLFEEQIEVVNQTLNEIGAFDKKTILLFNKIDNYSYTPPEPFDLRPLQKNNYSISDLQKIWIAKSNKSIFISAKNKINIELFKKILYDEVKSIHKIRYPFNDFLYPDNFQTQ